MSVFETDRLTFAYGDAPQPAVHDLTLRVHAGEFFAILGPNGSGKSTLLRVLLGLLAPTSGSARFGGRPLSEWSRRALAERIGVVAQTEEPAFPIRVRELVELGRYPHLGPWRRPGPLDRAAVDDAMRRCEVGGIEDRLVSTLSGGERQRVRIARALAQQPSTLVLDEPTASLDIAHEMAIFELLASLAAGGATVLLVTHNINLAARYAGRLLLLDEGAAVAVGAPGDVLRRDVVEAVYRWPVAITRYEPAGPDHDAPQIVALRTLRDGRARTRAPNATPPHNEAS